MNLYYKLRYTIGNLKKSFKEKLDEIYWNNEKISNIKSSRKKLKELHNKFIGQRCFIVGNGPSINQMDLNLMKDDCVFVSNSFFLKFDDLDFRPQFITVEDHLVAEDNKYEFESLRNILKFYPDISIESGIERFSKWVKGESLSEDKLDYANTVLKKHGLMG